MEAILNNIDLIFIQNSISSVIKTISIADVIDVVLVALLIYQILMLVQKTRAIQLLKGILFLLAASFLAEQLQLRTVSYILNTILQFGFMALVVVFQPELRRALEQMGRTSILGFSMFNSVGKSEESRQSWQRAIVAICDSAEQMSETRTGALIAIERGQSMQEILHTGTPMNSEINPEIVSTIFFEGSPLHDGSVVVRGGKIAAAGCLLPLSPNLEISKDMGTRHRAALGLSEESDALIVVVSEETGIVSLAKDGILIRRLDRQNLYNVLTSELLPPEPEKKEKKTLFGRKKI